MQGDKKWYKNSPAVPQPNENSQVLLLSADLPMPASEMRTSSKSIHMSEEAESRLVNIYNKNIVSSQRSSPDNNSGLT